MINVRLCNDNVTSITGTSSVAELNYELTQDLLQTHKLMNVSDALTSYNDYIVATESSDGEIVYESVLFNIEMLTDEPLQVGTEDIMTTVLQKLKDTANKVKEFILEILEKIRKVLSSFTDKIKDMFKSTFGVRSSGGGGGSSKRNVNKHFSKQEDDYFNSIVNEDKFYQECDKVYDSIDNDSKVVYKRALIDSKIFEVDGDTGDVQINIKDLGEFLESLDYLKLHSDYVSQPILKTLRDVIDDKAMFLSDVDILASQIAFQLDTLQKNLGSGNDLQIVTTAVNQILESSFGSVVRTIEECSQTYGGVISTSETASMFISNESVTKLAILNVFQDTFLRNTNTAVERLDLLGFHDVFKVTDVRNYNDVSKVVKTITTLSDVIGATDFKTENDEMAQTINIIADTLKSLEEANKKLTVIVKGLNTNTTDPVLKAFFKAVTRLSVNLVTVQTFITTKLKLEENVGEYSYFLIPFIVLNNNDVIKKP